MPKIEARSRAQIAEFLPRALTKALESYQVFCELDASSQAKEFKAHHDACKVAVSHIELLIKLAVWADLPDPKVEGQDQHAMLTGLIESAKAEIDKR